MVEEKKDKNMLDEKNIKELKDDELKNKILDINGLQLCKIGEMSYYYFINTSMDLIQLIEENNFFEKLNSNKEKEIIKTIFEHVTNTFIKLNTRMNECEIENEINILLDMREQLYNILKSIRGYKIELFYIKDYMDYYMMKSIGEKEYNNMLVNQNELALIINKIEKVLADNINNHITFINIVSNILEILPFRMSKYKYFDVIKETLSRNLREYPTDLVESEIEYYKMIFDSSIMGDYGVMFDDYFTNIQLFKNIDYKSLSIDEMEEQFDEIFKLILEFEEIEMFIMTLGMLINRLISMLLIISKSTLDIIDSNKLYSIWEKQERNFDKQSMSRLKKLTDKAFINAEKDLVQYVKYFETLNNEALRRPDFLDEELNKKLLFTNKVLTFYNDTSLVEYEKLFPEDVEIIKEYYLKQLIDSLIQYINRSISTMDNIERKLRMRRLLSAMELPFKDIDEFISYIAYSLDERVVSKEEILFIIEILNNWLDSREEGQ
ncbi:hypothetical protein EDD65_10225 [Keratinibaculum paraultunense]|uniref:Uncharacterized protein n=1 Tax=Keratinibaculum paraultunense TaxID=1278232 RepID=A0A4R3KZ81_9FIRM|nr:hypothetical protein [Keratinibaculum paraultunense]QQY80386.1 hypothetical protein JL105_03510 [Keratinibaculum paraultunense]TCS91099.1 hypothetical protein EDD65_10225 [Keratinibaculum paraultunense]